MDWIKHTPKVIDKITEIILTGMLGALILAIVIFPIWFAFWINMYAGICVLLFIVCMAWNEYRDAPHRKFMGDK